MSSSREKKKVLKRLEEEVRYRRCIRVKFDNNANRK